MLAGCFRHVFFEMFLVALILTLLGCTELLFAGASNWVFMRTQRTLTAAASPLCRTADRRYDGFMDAIRLGIRWDCQLPGWASSWRKHTRPPHPAMSLYTLWCSFSLPFRPIMRCAGWSTNRTTLRCRYHHGWNVHGINGAWSTERSRRATARLRHSRSSRGRAFSAGRPDHRRIGAPHRHRPVRRGEITAVGFVFTAKSIVRYHDFAKPDFAEYYLIGTLYSVVIAVMLSLLL